MKNKKNPIILKMEKYFSAGILLFLIMRLANTNIFYQLAF